MQSLYGAIANYKFKKNMAINVDKVYQKVLALANKEQRGYITPQEFNLFADHAQMDIFEQYFYDLEQRQRATGNDTDYADIVTNLEEKISMFEIANQSVIVSGGEVHISDTFPDFYRLGTVSASYLGYSGVYCEVEPIKLSELRKYEKSPLAIWTKSRPVYSQYSTADSEFLIRIYPTPQPGDDQVSINYVRKPISPNWTYLIGSNKNALYNPSAAGHRNFELHASEETNLVLKILQLAGVSIKDLQLAGVASQEEIKGIQQEKR
tara:strand:+ start:833 stop:1627 length:795 start_codon:yes stop_codon:yes gene_type:complete